MNSRAVTFARHVHQALSPYRWTLAISISLMVSSVFTGFALTTRANSNQQLLETLSPYLATLVESQDRTEILRILEAVSEKRGTKLVLVQNGIALASTRSISEMDQPFRPIQHSFSFFGITLTGYEILGSTAVARTDSPDQGVRLYSFTPLRPTAVFAMTIAIVTFLTGVFASLLFGRKMKSAIHGALLPLEILHREIQAIGDAKAPSSQPILIQELEEIRRTISKTKIDLANARERLAEERARQLTAKSYKDLIHDLHNPVAALRQWITILTSPETEPDDREEAKEAVPRISDQILRQVDSAKKNLEVQPEALRESDLRECVKASLQQIRSLAAVSAKTTLSLSLPDSPVVAAHDPDLLQRAVMNLLENGIEASREKVELVLEQEGTRALIRVSDDGAGMNESDVTIYLQGRGQSKKAPREALGLSSVNHIVRTHGGKLVYRRSPLGGAAFEIRLEAR
ncbi:MAG TPA: hypothetical protein DCS07_09930 [Bdellovibrionales bacterium]|nr:MAG: hypothetical protein A2Z97_04370 [Bdellovibrionales bacterium GWB1_52_6]OFZ02715.1 MAG: hypothetical protein A2X97_12290 [Bdellovibrionales bacterium GWA1_52_35]OFZ39754.1 MAG: hypothetical protein A2070_01010 [Bdellovibrionales bacterium GWC1_52_8]HAR42931.1 hypothetical protein [Bdellovibrionales bacterium]HCM41613.1 hypothetical protein [Bdellovibrionales bacterium]